MAIIGPPDLPKVIKVDSNPLKARTLSWFGHPNTRVEITDPQLEQSLRVAGDLVSTYFPLEERYSFFYTQPLVDEYDVPEDAYWVREVAWDSVITKIQDVFSAEMFLFCGRSDMCILRHGGNGTHMLVPVLEWDEEWLAHTPYGPTKVKLLHHEHLQPLIRVVYESGELICTTNQPIKTGGFDIENSLEGWEVSVDLNKDHKITGVDCLYDFIEYEKVNDDKTVTVISPYGCFYGCTEGEPILLH